MKSTRTDFSHFFIPSFFHFSAKCRTFAAAKQKNTWRCDTITWKYTKSTPFMLFINGDAVVSISGDGLTGLA